jgi:2-methylcitrate dehydratase PrpD
MNATSILAKNIVDTHFEDIPSNEIEATKRSILDTLGIMFPPSTLVNTCAYIYELMSEAGGKPESTIIGFGGKAPCWIAAYVNGSSAHAVDFDNCVGLEKPIHHPTASSLPAALAMAEKIGNISGKDLLTAVALGDDLGTRIAACPKGNIVNGYPFFAITTFGVFQAAAISAKLMGFTESRMVNTLGLALNRVSGTVKGLFTSDLRAVRDGLNAREGILCALLAGKGMDSCKDAIEILFDVYFNNDVDTSGLTVDLGRHFRGSEAGYKPWPSCQGTHSYIQSMLQIVNSHSISPDEVEEITIRGNKEGYVLATPVEVKQNPTSSITAKISLPFVMGVVIVHKNVTLTNFLPENLHDFAVLNIAKKVKFELDNSLSSFSTLVEVKTKYGQVCSASTDVLKGSIGNPLSNYELIAKFKNCARYSKKPLSAEKVDRLIDRILNLEKVKDITEITRLIG